MSGRLSSFLLAGLFIALGGPFLSADEPPRRLGVGLNYGGGQIDWRASQRWMLDLRFQQGADKSDGVKTTSSLVGGRAYRFLRGGARVAPFLGIEAASVKSKRESYDASGFSGGGFAGLSVKISRHFLFEMDAGPYLISLRQRRTETDKSDMEFVGDASLILFF